jgi:hypothetical protein
VTTSAEKTSFLAPGLKYGLIAAAGMAASLLAAYALGLHTRHFGIGAYTDSLTPVILVAALWRMLHQLLNTANRYWLPVWVGLLHGLFASLVAAMGFYIAFSLYLRFVNPGYPDLYLEWRFAQMRAAGQSESEIGMMARTFRWSMGPTGLPVTILGFYLLVGTIASPILTLWLNWRRKEVVHPA